MKIKNGLLLLMALSLMISLSSCDPKKNSGPSSDIEPSSNVVVDSSCEEPVFSSEDLTSSDIKESSSSSEESSSSSSSSSQETQTFTVIWKNYNGEILEIDYKVAYGATPSYDFETPTREEDNEYKYVFIGWTPAITPVTSNQTYTATYNQVAKN